ncbi:hypothetical protein N7495_002847 [Penicillium taxi]|uniref:uncharacterized protein n=1 Tax=Penicillium taxi TaxID=168475 RepID=UPI002545254A|nr:uncharacterized protein N7495_002847 [Penicillium taxi]KAJ5902319.1 hypothetical protein N7495_002847 [Penicillium taxi]
MRPAMRTPLRGAFYVCSNCKQGVVPTGISPAARQFRRYASSDDAPGFLERTRRKLWKDGKAPGGKDPYTGESQLTRSPAHDEDLELAPGSDDASRDLAPGDNYKQAQTWDDLETIGFSGEEPFTQRETPRKTDNYQRYDAKVFPQSHGPAAYQAAVEICLMHMLGKPLTSISGVTRHNKVVRKMLKTCTLEGQNWETSLRFPDQQTMEALVFVFNQIGPKSTKTVEWSESWIAQKDFVEGHKGLSLTDSQVKFAFAKRYSQLMGRIIPDKIINSSTTVGDFVSALSNDLKEKPVNVANVLAKETLPHNIKFSAKRETRADRDEDLGRKKAITAELYERGLILPKTKKFSSFKRDPSALKKTGKLIEA